ncbi:MAG TPA: threonine synthase [Bdellovibrionota bacterium]|nr:threonine synthase [Bdellovibrionota bacterium]
MTLLERYRKRLPVSDKTPIVSLGEGGTPLLRSHKLEKALNSSLNIFLKIEGANPTGSFKDRGMTMAISNAKEHGAKAVVCASTGNTSASAAAYASAAGLDCVVLLPRGQVALGKLSQALIAGAKVVAVDGNFDAALGLVKEAALRFPVTIVNSINPFRIHGQKTAAFEVSDQLGLAPDYHVLPVGNAGNITAYWAGYRELYEDGTIPHLPRMIGFQAAGAAPIVLGRVVEKPETIATAIRIGNPASWAGAIHARDESGGLIDKVEDEEILRAYQWLAREEGIFVEPASGAAVAGLFKLDREKKLPSEGILVCTLTGHGLKDPDRAIASCPTPPTIAPDMKALIKVLGW